MSPCTQLVQALRYELTPPEELETSPLAQARTDMDRDCCFGSTSDADKCAYAVLTAC